MSIPLGGNIVGWASARRNPDAVRSPRCRLKTQMAAQQCRAADIAIPTQNGTDNKKCRLKGLQTALCSDGRAYFAACSPSLAKYLA
ncbi:TPA: hypothetical protein ACQUH7_000146 [Neisseria lactamica]